ncbi:MAG TPA: hypothetical protein VH062_11610 [Polyangiaceae bacterium]|jgi:hypothetical protein|nr:hypothetical protein [Polyangiaceae bacterium]
MKSSWCVSVLSSLLLAGCGSATDFSATNGGTGTDGEPSTTGTASETLTLTTSDRIVPPGAEIYGCQDFQNPYGKDVAIVRSTSSMTPGSHHMFAFVMPNDELSLYDSLADCPNGGVEFHEYLHTSQLPEDHMAYPPGVGRMLPSGSGFRIMLHLLNTGTDPLVARVDFGLEHVAPTAVPGKAASMFLNNLALQVPVGKSTQRATFTLPSSVMMLRVSSHMHQHGALFAATTGDGSMLYTSDVWNEPIPRLFDPPLSIPAGTTITWSCEFNNDTGSMLAFGESAAKNEMCILSASFFDTVGAQMNAQYPLP